MKTGMNHPIEAPPLKPRPWGLLLDAAYEIPVPDDKIGAGVTFRAYGSSSGMERIDSKFCDDVAAENDAASGGLPEFESFTIRGTQTCSALDVDLLWLNGRIDTRWAAYISSQVAAELASGGSTTPDSPNLSTAATVSSTQIDALDEGSLLALLDEQLAADLHGAQGMVHVDPAVFNFIADNLIRDGSVWYTPTGHIVVSDAGYLGAVPDGESGSGVSWAFTSGMVGVKVGPLPPIDQDAVQYLDRTRNDIHGRRLAKAVFAFDPATVGAVAVSWLAGS